MHYDIIMVTTFVDDDYIDGLLRSVIENNHTLDVMLVVVDQMGGPALRKSDNLKVHIECLRVEGPLALSRARNVALEYITRSGIKASHIMFPDDDVTFDRQFFDHLKNIVRPDMSYMIVIYNEGTNDYFKPIPAKDGKRLKPKHFEYSSSVNMIITQDACDKAGGFDEMLGVGAQYGSSEDADFFIRISKYAPFVFTNKLYVFHPSKKSLFAEIPFKALIKKYTSYSKGHIYLVYRHHMYWLAPKSVVRAIGASIHFLLRLQLKRSLVQFLTAMARLRYSCEFLLRYKEIIQRERGAYRPKA